MIENLMPGGLILIGLGCYAGFIHYRKNPGPNIKQSSFQKFVCTIICALPCLVVLIPAFLLKEVIGAYVGMLLVCPGAYIAGFMIYGGYPKKVH